MSTALGLGAVLLCAALILLAALAALAFWKLLLRSFIEWVKSI